MGSLAYVLENDSEHRHEFHELNPLRLVTKEAVWQMVQHDRTRALWIAVNEDAVYWLAEALTQHQTSLRGSLLSMQEVPPALAAFFRDKFEMFVQRPPTMLPLREVAATLAREDRADLCIGGTVLERAGMVALVRGDLSVLNVSLSSFVQVRDGPAPDPSRFEVVDHGRTLKFGEYEAAFDAVLYERDAAYRRRLKALRVAQDESLGGSLRRLRKQRGLKLSDMGPLERSVARIERGEVSKPRKATMSAIAEILGVEPEQIKEF